jgi:predicted Holliday junction resolvase-like endonuclease
VKNKFFPTFEQDISATVKLCVLTVAFIVLATWAAYAAQKAITKIYRKMEAEDMEFYRRAQESETRQRNRRKYASGEPTLQSVPQNSSR